MSEIYVPAYDVNGLNCVYLCGMLNEVQEQVVAPSVLHGYSSNGVPAVQVDKLAIPVTSLVVWLLVDVLLASAVSWFSGAPNARGRVVISLPVPSVESSMKVTIKSTVLNDLAESVDSFKKGISGLIGELLVAHTGRQPVLSPRRLEEAYKYWVLDVERIKLSLPNGCIPDHFKQAAHLAYWLRRTSPVVEFHGLATIEPSADQHKVWDFMATYANEYVAYEIGFLICSFFEIAKRQNPGSLIQKFNVDAPFVRDICAFLKEKNVSPHALYLVYKSLFYNRY